MDNGSARESALLPRLPRGFVSCGEAELKFRAEMIGRIGAVYECYGFEAVETPMIEYAEMLGDFLPDRDRPNAGRFSFRDDDGQWLSLRYDLTAPLARHVAENFEGLAKPYRSYRVGYVFRNEKTGPGRFRQFMQCDADTVGSSSMAADAEMCMMAADCMEAVSLRRGEYRVRVNSRKLLDGVMEAVGLAGTERSRQRLAVMRAVDKLDRLGLEGVCELLGAGRRDESGDFTAGACLDAWQIDAIMNLISIRNDDRTALLADVGRCVDGSDIGMEGVRELDEMIGFLSVCGYEEDRVVLDPSVVRGLEYYTGPVYEVELTTTSGAIGSTGVPVRFGSVGGGGRYDSLVGRFSDEVIPATGFSVGVSRLQSALEGLQKWGRESCVCGPVVVLVMDRERLPAYQSMVQDLRESGIRAELYLGSGGMRAQLKYADRRHAPLVVIQGGDEHERGELLIKDMVAGERLSKVVKDNKEWREGNLAQISIPAGTLVEEVRRRLATAKGIRDETGDG